MGYIITMISLYFVYAVCRSQERRVVIWRTFWWMTDRVPAETKGAVFFDTPMTVMIMGRAAKEPQWTGSCGHGNDSAKGRRFVRHPLMD